MSSRCALQLDYAMLLWKRPCSGSGHRAWRVVNRYGPKASTAKMPSAVGKVGNRSYFLFAYFVIKAKVDLCTWSLENTTAATALLKSATAAADTTTVTTS